MSTYNNNNNNSFTSISLRNTGGVLDGAYVQPTPNTQFSATTNQSIPYQTPTIFRILPDGYPNNQNTVSADAFSWNQENLDAQGSDGTQTINIISNVTFTDSPSGPGTLENTVDVFIIFNPDFQIPTEYANSTYTIELDLQGKAQPFLGGRYVNICLINDFADTVDVDQNKYPYNSGIKSMTSSATLQNLWHDAFKNKTPLKYGDSVVFIPSEDGDALGQPISVFDSRQHHASEEYEDPSTWSDHGYGMAAVNASGMQQGRRKDVIHLGFNASEPGTPLKIGTFKLKLYQDIFSANVSFSYNSPEAGYDNHLQEMNAGKRSRGGFVNGCNSSKPTGTNIIAQKRFWFNHGNINMNLNTPLDDFRPGSPLGLIPTTRTRFTADGNATYTGNFGPGNSTGVQWTDEDFDGPYAIGAKPRFFLNDIIMGIRNDAEIITEWHGGVEEAFISGQTNILHGPEVFAYQFGGGISNTGEDYVYTMLNNIGVGANTTNYDNACQTILWWQQCLYQTLDLHCWSMFPAFKEHNSKRNLSDQVDRIVSIVNNINSALSIDNFVVRKWAEPGWEDDAFTFTAVQDAFNDIINPASTGYETAEEFSK